MVSWLIEDQQIDRLQQQANHRQTGTLTAGEHLHLLVGGFATKHEGTEQIPNLQTHITLSNIVDRLEHSQILIEQLRLVLGKVANLDVMPQLQFTGVVVDLTHDTFHEGRFTFTILADKGYLITPMDREGHMVKDQVIAVTLRHLLTDHGIGA